MRMTGGEALSRQLVAEGVSRVFGLPGVQLDYALDGLAQDHERIRFFNTRHEQAAAYMADGYARASGEVGVFMVVPGPGLLNAAAGLATAYACSSPVLCVCGQIPSGTIGRGYGLLHEIPDQTGILRRLTKWSGFASAPGQIPGLVREAFCQLRSGRPQPVAIEVPPDVLQATVEVDIARSAAEGALTGPDQELLRAAAAILESARHPAIYVGGGVLAADATEPLQLVAERLEAAVVMSPNARGALSDRHRLALPSLASQKILADADAVLAVGTRFRAPGGLPVTVGDGAAVIHLNADQRDLDNACGAKLRIHCDARRGLAGLLDQLDPTVRPGRTELDSVRQWCAETLAPLEPQMSWVRALRAAIPEDGVLVSEFTQVGYIARMAYPVYRPRTYIGPGYQGTLGYGFPTALGVKVAVPERAVVSITGDGGFGYSLQELSTARKYGIGLVTVVFDDGAFGNVRRDQREKFAGRFIGSDLHNPDFVQLARAFGVDGCRVQTPDELVGALREALSGDEPFLIEVPVGEMPNPWGLLGRSMGSTEQRSTPAAAELADAPEDVL
jgi:acetolactate synthase I/II/III large subunit